eukprot:1160669-Pelagomonas_calceolata.AAC.10
MEMSGEAFWDDAGLIVQNLGSGMWLEIRVEHLGAWQYGGTQMKNTAPEKTNSRRPRESVVAVRE